MISLFARILRQIRAGYALPAALLMLSVAAAHARAQDDESNQPTQTKDEAAADVPEPTAFEWSLLDPSIPVTIDKTYKYRAPATLSGPSANWDRTEKDDGGSAVTVKRSVLPFWDTKVGADMNVAPDGPVTSGELLARQAQGDTTSLQSGGSVWATMSAPGVAGIWDKTSLNARIDPSADQNKIGTAISKTIPIDNNQYALTVQNGYAVAQPLDTPIAGLGPRTGRSIEVDRSAKLEFRETGTSLIAGETQSSLDNKWLGRVGAEQKLFGGVSISGTYAQTADGFDNKSLTAGYKYHW
ncbi:MAG: hypothetical protein EKK36_05615 [Bradyrhizobiaceae bacterium]|nr:MAG: hypothetical protein EKK36_05615 [Bradyrhizobiaceae bacterium]